MLCCCPIELLEGGCPGQRSLEGEVEFAGELGKILAGAMEGSEINRNTKEPLKYKITQDDIPKFFQQKDKEVKKKSKTKSQD